VPPTITASSPLRSHWSVPLLGYRNVYSAASPTALAGEYLVAVPGFAVPRPDRPVIPSSA